MTDEWLESKTFSNSSLWEHKQGSIIENPIHLMWEIGCISSYSIKSHFFYFPSLAISKKSFLFCKDDSKYYYLALLPYKDYSHNSKKFILSHRIFLRFEEAIYCPFICFCYYAAVSRCKIEITILVGLSPPSLVSCGDGPGVSFEPTSILSSFDVDGTITRSLGPILNGLFIPFSSFPSSLPLEQNCRIECQFGWHKLGIVEKNLRWI